MEDKPKTRSTPIELACYLAVIGVLAFMLASCSKPPGPSSEEAERRYQAERQLLTQLEDDFKKQEDMLKASADLAARRGATDEQLDRMEADIAHAIESFRTRLQEQQERVNRAREARDPVSHNG